MLLRENNTSSSRVFLSALPLLYSTAAMQVRGILYMGISIVGLFWVTALFFLFCTPFFPRRFRQAGYVCWLAVLAQAGYVFFGLPPVWIVSLSLLMPSEVFDRRKKGGKASPKIFLRGIFFILFLVYLAAFQDLLGARLLIWTFRTPAGSLLLLAAAAFLWKNQPDAGQLAKRGSDD